MKLSSMFVLGMLLILLISCVPTPTERPVVFVLLPCAEGEIAKERYEATRQYLEATLERPVTLMTVTNYAAVTEALKRSDPKKEIMIVRFGPFEFVLANTQVEVEALVRGIKLGTGKDIYYPCIIARSDSGIENLEDVVGKPFAFVDIGSTSGYLVPKGIFKLAGISEDDLGDVFFAGGHDALILAVKQGKTVVAGATNVNRYERALDSGVITGDDVVIIYQGDPIATSPVACRADLDEETKEQLREAFLGMPREITEEGPRLIGWALAFNKDYQFVADLAVALGLMSE